MARRGISSKAMREVAAEARDAARRRASARAMVTEQSDPEASQVAQRVFNAVTEARRTGEAGDVSPLLWGPLAVAGEMMAAVVIKANEMPSTEEMHVEVAAYFVAGFLAGGHGFDREHFEGWRGRSADIDLRGAAHDEVEPG